MNQKILWIEKKFFNSKIHSFYEFFPLGNIRFYAECFIEDNIDYYGEDLDLDVGEC